MSPDERALLQIIGRFILQNFVTLTPIVVLHGIFIMLFPFSTFTLLQRGPASRPTQAMLGTTLIAFLVSSFLCISTVSNNVITIREALFNSTGMLDFSILEKFSKSISKTSSIQAVAFMLIPILNDSVVIWRAWVLYLDRQWIMLVPCAFLFGTIGATVTYLVFDFKFFQSSMLDPVSSDVFKASLTLSLGTNVTATSLIFYRLWGHHRFLRRMGIKQNSTSPVQKILIVLVESGLAYCALQITIIVLEFISTPTFSFLFASGALLNVLMLMTAMYPSIVILLVSVQRATAETFIFSTQVGDRSVQDIELAHVSTAAACVSKVANTDGGPAGKALATSTNVSQIRANDCT
ncbi:hypothetical protein D9615_008062 [Tricholomella constricta]|uniref:Uncharacterized protein n=1 Tax=Tricholomella constricta TaxID=117010 RepID=A0A8H5LWB9_9AGAR|nr:hypothetical protein D9615_008062 [Tricholomella constricta]